MKLLCVLVRHQWRRGSTEDGERYERCQRCGRYSDPPGAGAKNVSAL